MLVCSERCDEVEKCLVDAGGRIVKVRDGEAAVSQTLRHAFDAAVLVSTGSKMDLAETAFNLRDIRESMEILIVAGVGQSTPSAVAGEVLARSVPNTKVLTVKELEALLSSSRGSPRKR